MKGHILVIDDSLTIRRLLETALVRSGFTLDSAASGGDGIALAKRVKPDLILLDYVLPDMKGLEVSGALAADETTQRIPIVVMSAKGEALRPVFRGEKAVAGFLPKPFTAPEALFLVGELLRGPSGETPAILPRPSLDREEFARAVFSALRDRLSLIPEWMGQCGTQNPAAFFGRKILTPSAVEALVGATAPFLGPTGAAPVEEGLTLRGHTNIVPLMSLLTQLGALSRSGLLRLERPGRKTFIFFHRGDLVLASGDDAEDALRLVPGGLPAIDPGARGAAIANQLEEGKPAILAYAATLGERLKTVLYEESLRVLVAAIQSGTSAFLWTESTVPDWALENSRVCTLEQVQLSRLREVDDWTQVETQVASLDRRFSRAAKLGHRLAKFALTDNERRVLTVVNGRNTVGDLIERTSLPTFEVFHTLFRLLQVGLISRNADEAGTAEISLADAPCVLIQDADLLGVVEPLSEHFRKRRPALPMVRVPPGEEIGTAMSRRRPQLVLLDGSQEEDVLRRAVESVRNTLEVSDATLVALLSVAQAEAGARQTLQAIGFDEFLVRPFLYSDVERLLRS